MSDERLIRIEDKIDKVFERLSSVEITLSKQHDSLEYHIRRTDLLEAEFKPVRDNLRLFKVCVQWISILGILAGIAKLVL